VLANLCLFRVDRRLSGAASQRGVAYTRYADDLVFSGGRESRREVRDLRHFILAILSDEGFLIRGTKSRLMCRGGRQHVCGLNLNACLNVPRAEYDTLRAVLHRCGRQGFGPEEASRLDSIQRHLRGRIEYVGSVNPARREKLLKLYARIRWPEKGGTD
jgi:hypothetical protein